MKSTLKTVAWVEIILGILAFIGWLLEPSDMYVFFGSALWITFGIVALKYIKEVSTTKCSTKGRPKGSRNRCN